MKIEFNIETEADKEAAIKQINQIKTEPVYRNWEDLTEEENILFEDEKIRKKIIATRKLAILMALPEYNGEWKPDFTDRNTRYCIDCSMNTLIKHGCVSYHYFLVFKTSEIRNKFLERNEQLIKDYFML